MRKWLESLPRPSFAREAPRRTAPLVAITLIVLPLLALTACDDDVEPAGADAPVTREILGQLAGTEAGGYDLHFQRITIAPGVALPEHIHPGIQVARIESGELTYHILSGTAAIARDRAEEPTEHVEGPATTTLYPGDTIYEMDDMEHYGENIGDEPVVLILTALIEGGEPLSVEIEP